jgi:hypothetical protein
MEKQIEAAILALENIAALDEACKLVQDEISVNILSALDEYIEQAIESCKEYEGVFDFHEDQEDGSTWFAPKDWLAKDEDEVLEEAFLWCGLRECDTSNSEAYNSFYITSLIGSGAQKMCFAVSVSRSLFPKLGKKECRIFIQNVFDKNRLRDQGLRYDPAEDRGIIIPFVVDHESLMVAYRDEEFTEAFEPIGKAIEKAKEVMGMFSVPVKELQHKYPRPTED